MRRVLSFITIIAIIFSSFVSAIPQLEKDETVYVNLDYYGAVDEINVYNSYITNGQTQIIDYADYENITNLTDKQEPQKISNGIKFNTPNFRNFSYMGKVSNEKAKDIPWTFDVSYKLNGVITDAKKLLGAYGLVEINIDINANKDTTAYYQNNYLLEVTSSFNMEDYLSVESDNAVFVTTGKTKTLMFIVLPGQSTSLNLKIGSEDFKMDGITFAAIPLTGELLDDITDIIDDKDDIEDASDAVNESTDILLSSLSSMTSSLSRLKDGILNLKSGSDNLYNLKDKRDTEIASFKKSLENIEGLINNSKKDLSNLKGQVEDLTDMLEETQDLTKSLQKKSDRLLEHLDLMQEVVDKLPTAYSDIRYSIRDLGDLLDDFNDLLKIQLATSAIDTNSLEENLNNIVSKTKDIGDLVQAGVTTAGDVDTKNTLLQIGSSAGAIKNSLTSISEDMTSIKELLSKTTTVSQDVVKDIDVLTSDLKDVRAIFDTTDARIITATFESANSFFNELDKSFDILTKYNDKFLSSKEDIQISIDDLTKILDEINSLNNTFINLTGILQSSLDIIDTQVYSGLTKTSDGLISITDDLMRVTKESNTFRSSKNKIKDIIDDRMDEIEEKTTLFNIDKNAKVVSFTSSKNISPDLVQFMFKTPDISEVNQNIEDLEPKDIDEGFWNRFVGIIKKIWESIIGIFK